VVGLCSKNLISPLDAPQGAQAIRNLKDLYENITKFVFSEILGIMLIFFFKIDVNFVVLAAVNGEHW